MSKRYITSTIIIFIILSAVFFAIKMYRPDYNYMVLEAGNVVMAALSLLTYSIIRKPMSGRPEAFVRGVYSASFLKLIVCMMSILVYVLVNREHIHKPTVFVLLGIYAVYTTMETMLLSKLVKG